MIPWSLNWTLVPLKCTSSSIKSDPEGGDLAVSYLLVSMFTLAVSSVGMVGATAHGLVLLRATLLFLPINIYREGSWVIWVLMTQSAASAVHALQLYSTPY